MSWEPTWEGLGATLGHFSMSKTNILEDNFFLANIAFFSRFFGVSWGRVSKWDPRADPRSVTMRGGPPPAWLNGVPYGPRMDV